MIGACLIAVVVGFGPNAPLPVYLPYCSMAEVMASPEWATIERNRHAHELADLRDVAEAEAAQHQPADGDGPTDPGPATVEPPGVVTAANHSPAQPSPGLIEWRPEVERWRSLVALYFLSGDRDHALAIVRCESVGDPEATNPSSGTAGLFQHRPAYWPARSAQAGWAGHSPYEPEANIAVAAWLVYQGGGWVHWSGRAWGVDSCEEYAQSQGV